MMDRNLVVGSLPHLKFVPLTNEELAVKPCRAITGKIGRVKDGYCEEFVALKPDGDGTNNTAYTHPTLFKLADTISAQHGTNRVRVWLQDSNKLYLRFLRKDSDEPLENTPILESKPVKTSFTTLSLVAALREFVYDDVGGGFSCDLCHCGDIDNEPPLSMDNMVIVMTDFMEIKTICSDCCAHHLPVGWTVLLKGWELPPRAPVTLWDIPKTSVVGKP